ncbi:MAG: response regulator [Pseudomonadota bacterium]
MSRKRALIVDDSRSARIVLQRMLTTHELDVDMAESAEQALDYLTEHRPDVIFMDHMMPGMDGFEAVRAIKRNPETATIPIMMYTSQEGELYVGQARALGAVGVLPKQIAPVEVSRVLKSLRLVPGVDDTPAEPTAVDGSATSTNDEVTDSDLRAWIQDLFAEQRAVIRRDLLDSYETIAARVVDEISPEAANDDETDVSEPPSIPLGIVASLALLALAALAFAWLYWRAESNWQQAEAMIAELTSERQTLRSQTADGTLALQEALNDERDTLQARYQASLDLIAWAFNNGNRYGFQAVPLGDRFAERLAELIGRLDDIGFAGNIMIETHVGDFCTVTNADGDIMLAPPILPVAQCEGRELDIATADQLGSQQSVAFANLIETVGERTSGRITVGVVTLANTEPLLPYPSIGSSSAAAWNTIALANQRIEIRLAANEVELEAKP